MSAVFVILAILILGATAMTSAGAMTLHGNDAAGNGLAYAYTMIVAIGLWVMMIVPAIVAYARGEGARIFVPAAIVLIPAAGAACLAAIHTMSMSSDLRWPIVSIAVPPLLILMHLAWVFFPSVRSIAPPAGAWLIWLAVVVLAVLPWPARAKALAERSRIIEENYQKSLAEEEAGKSAAANDREERLAKLTPDARLWDCWNLVRYADVRDRAMDVARGLKNRQADAEEMARLGYPDLIAALPELDLQPSPVLADNVKAFLLKLANDVREFDPNDPRPASVAIEPFSRYVPTVAWLIRGGRDLTDVAAAMEAKVKAYPDSPARQAFLQSLDVARGSR